MKRLTAMATALLLVAMGLIELPAGQAENDLTPQRITSLVEQLGASKFAAREEAARKIRAVGVPALDALRAASRSTDPELQMRASALLPEIEMKAASVEGKQRQLAAAKRLKLPVEKEISLGGEIKLALRLIPEGVFDMGSESKPGRTTPVHRVRIAKPFYIGKFEVTQKQYQQVMGKQPSETAGDDLPVENISWNQARDFCAKVSKTAGMAIRLPTEAEWEYACRAGTRTEYYTGDTEAHLDKIAWYVGNSGGKLHPVGKKQPNAFGLHDMLGSVWEMCEDDWHRDYRGAPADGSAWVNEPRIATRSIRGGNWRLGAHISSSAHRSGCSPPTEAANWIGFRIVASP